MENEQKQSFKLALPSTQMILVVAMFTILGFAAGFFITNDTQATFENFDGDFEEIGMKQVDNSKLVAELESFKTANYGRDLKLFTKLDTDGDVLLYIPFRTNGPDFMSKIIIPEGG